MCEWESTLSDGLNFRYVRKPPASMSELVSPPDGSEIVKGNFVTCRGVPQLTLPNVVST